MKTRTTILLIILKKGMVFCSLMAFPLLAIAARASAPWEGPLNKLAQNLTSSTSTSIALVGLFVAGGTLVFGGDLATFAKRITWMCLAISLMLSGGFFVNMFTDNTTLPPAATGAILL